MRALKWIILPLLAVHVALATWSGYRAIVQVFELELHSTSAVLTRGSTVGADVVSSGRVPVTLRLELVQGARVETLAVTRVRDSENPSYDPRSRRGAVSVALDSAVLTRLSPGPATLRATALGASQWLRTPPPTIRELAVRVER